MRKGQAVYVTDASRAVGVVQALLSTESRGAYIDTVRAEYGKVAEAHRRSEADKQRLPLAKARANAFKPDWASYAPPRPLFTGTRVFRTYDVGELVPYIDWTPFFQTWELRGRYPAILDDPKSRARRHGNCSTMRRPCSRASSRSVGSIRKPSSASGRRTALATISNFITGESRAEKLATFFTLRQQLSRRDGRPNLALADFVAPVETGKADYIGGFVVTSGAREDKISKRFAKANDDYGSILVKALADRLAEAFAERMHERVRREFWAYAPDESLTNEERINEAYRGIRPAPGYPAQPDHTEKATLFRLLEAERRIGVTLTESYAMWPGSSVSGLYLAHPEAHYFGVAKDRARSGRGLCAAQGHEHRGGRALARAGAEL